MGPLNNFKRNMRSDVGCRDQKWITDTKIMSAHLEIHLKIISLLCFESLRWRRNLKLLSFVSSILSRCPTPLPFSSSAATQHQAEVCRLAEAL